MAGIFESNRITDENIENIASGKVPFYAELTDTLDVTDIQKHKIPAPGANDVSCVIIVLRYDTELGPEIKRLIDNVINLAGHGTINYRLVLTRLDECDPQFNDADNIPNLYESGKVQEAVQRMSEQTGIPPLAISFVRNYTKEKNTHIMSHVLYMKVVEEVIRASMDQEEKRSIKKKLQKENAPHFLRWYGVSLNLNELCLAALLLILAVMIIYYNANQHLSSSKSLGPLN